MNDSEKPEQAPEDVPTGGASIGAKGRRSLSKSRRELTEDELGQSGVRLMLQDDVDRLEAEVSRLQGYEDRFHTADKQVAVLQEKRRRDIAIDVVYGICLSVGVGFVMRSLTLPAGERWPAIGVGILLVICGIATKVRGRL